MLPKERRGMRENGEEIKEKEKREERIKNFNNPLPLTHKRPEWM